MAHGNSKAWVLLACAWLIGLSLSAGPTGGAARNDPPSPLASPGVKVARVALSQRVFARLEAKGRPTAAMGIATAEPEGQTLVWTPHDARWYDRLGVMQRSVVFERELMDARAVRFAPGEPPSFVGLKPLPGRNEAVVLGPDGRVTARMKSWLTFDVGDVMGDSALEIVLPLKDGVAIHDRLGRRLAFVSAPAYVDHARVVPAIEGGPARIALLMHRDRGRRASIQVMDAEGIVHHAWDQPAGRGRRLWVIGWPGRPEGLWTGRDGAFVMTSTDGTELERYPVPGADLLRYIYGGQMAGGRKVFAASGGGYVCASLLAVVGPDAKLQYLETMRARTWAFDSEGPEGRRFFAAVGDEVREYLLTEP